MALFGGKVKQGFLKTHAWEEGFWGGKVLKGKMKIWYAGNNTKLYKTIRGIRKQNKIALLISGFDEHLDSN